MGHVLAELSQARLKTKDDRVPVQFSDLLVRPQDFDQLFFLHIAHLSHHNGGVVHRQAMDRHVAGVVAANARLQVRDALNPLANIADVLGDHGSQERSLAPLQEILVRRLAAEPRTAAIIALKVAVVDEEVVLQSSLALIEEGRNRAVLVVAKVHASRVMEMHFFLMRGLAALRDSLIAGEALDFAVRIGDAVKAISQSVTDEQHPLKAIRTW